MMSWSYFQMLGLSNNSAVRGLYGNYVTIGQSIQVKPERPCAGRTMMTAKENNNCLFTVFFLKSIVVQHCDATRFL